MDEHYLDDLIIAEGYRLDRIGKIFGLERYDWCDTVERDAEFRLRIAKAAFINEVGPAFNISPDSTQAQVWKPVIPAEPPCVVPDHEWDLL